MNQEEIEVRKLPKKSIIIIIVMSIVILLGFMFEVFSRNIKMEEVLADLGHKDVTKIEVINKMSVEDKVTKVKSTVYKIIFYDKTMQKECIGFIHRSNDGKYSKDLDCK